MSRTVAVLVSVLLAMLTGCSMGTGSSATADAAAFPAPAVEQQTPVAEGLEVAVLAGGCFWGVQGVFQHVEGVTSAVSGYAGGTAETATYADIGTGQTGHAEAVEITYDPAVVSYGDLLQIFFSVVHDPTELDRQGPDIGPQYRSTVFPSSDEQERVARAYISQLDDAGVFGSPIVTTIESGEFYPAETYHQDYMTRNPDDPYIVAHDVEKVEALKEQFADRYRDEPVLVRAS